MTLSTPQVADAKPITWNDLYGLFRDAAQNESASNHSPKGIGYAFGVLTALVAKRREAARSAGGGVPQVQCPRCFALNTPEALGKFCSVGDCPMYAPAPAATTANKRPPETEAQPADLFPSTPPPYVGPAADWLYLTLYEHNGHDWTAPPTTARHVWLPLGVALGGGVTAIRTKAAQSPTPEQEIQNTNSNGAFGKTEDQARAFFDGMENGYGEISYCWGAIKKQLHRYRKALISITAETTGPFGESDAGGARLPSWASNIANKALNPETPGPAQPVSEPREQQIDALNRFARPAEPERAAGDGEVCPVPPGKQPVTTETASEFEGERNVSPAARRNSSFDADGSLACAIGITQCGDDAPPASPSPVPPPTPPDAAQGKARCNCGGKYDKTGVHAPSCPAAPPAQGEGHKVFSLPSHTHKGVEHAVRFPNTGRVATDGKRYVLAEPTPAVPESGLRECPSQDEIVNRLVADGADRISAGWYASGYVTAWNTRPSPQAAIRVVGAEVVEAAKAMNAAIQTGLWQTSDGVSVKLSPIALNLTFALTRLQSTGEAWK